MKKNILLIILILGVFSNLSSQTYYNMWRGLGDSGQPEWVANLAMQTHQQVTGIDFTTASVCRGFVNGAGRWGLRKPGTSMDVYSLSNIINGISNLTLGVEGWICPEGISVRKLWDGVNTTLDLLSADGNSSIRSNGDANGLHISSAIGKKIYLYDKVYFNDKFWCTLGAGRNDDATINNPNNKMLRIGSNAGIGFWSNGQVGTDDTPNLWLLNDGNVRIGTMSTSYKLNVAGSIYSEHNGIQTLVGLDADSSSAWLGTRSNHGMYLGTNGQSSLYIDGGNTNNVYIGLTDATVATIRAELKNKYKLFVNKGILSEDYSIAPKSSWSDFVFDAGYQLKKIDELEAFIVENKHLPDVPSAQTVAEDGYSQHDMNKVLLQKIEELTLYTIQQQKEISALKAELDHMKK